MNSTMKLEANRCRTCYNASQGLIHLTVLTKCGENDQQISYAEILDDVCNINIFEDVCKELPQFICDGCTTKLKASHSFIQQSQEVNERLVALLGIQKEKNSNIQDNPLLFEMEYDSVVDEESKVPWNILSSPVDPIGFNIGHLNDVMSDEGDNDTIETLKNNIYPPNNASELDIAQILGSLNKKLDLLTENHEIFKSELKDIKNQNSLVLNALNINTDMPNQPLNKNSDVIETPLNKSIKYLKDFPISTIEDLKKIEDSINDSNGKEYISTIRAITGYNGLKKSIADIMAPKLLLDFNVDGGNNKQRLLDYPKFVSVLFHGTYDENCTEKTFKCHLRDALRSVKSRCFRENIKFKRKCSTDPKMVTKAESMAQSSVSLETKLIAETIETPVCHMAGEMFDDDLNKIDSKFPLETVQAVEEIENKLKSAEFAKKMKLYLFKLKAVSEDVASIFRELFTDELLNLYNWDGRWGKQALDRLVLVNVVLRDIFNQKAPSVFEKEVKKVVDRSHHRLTQKKYLKKNEQNVK